VKKRERFRPDRADLEHFAAEPVVEAFPVFFADENDRTARDLFRLHQREDFEKLIERAESAGQVDERDGVADQHVFPRKEKAHRDESVDVGIRGLFMGEADVASEGSRARIARAPVRGFHETRTAARENSEAFASESRREITSGGVSRVTRGNAGRSENTHHRVNPGEEMEPVGELLRDPQEEDEILKKLLRRRDVVRAEFKWRNHKDLRILGSPGSGVKIRRAAWLFSWF
jgi:hypothetical protein